MEGQLYTNSDIFPNLGPWAYFTTLNRLFYRPEIQPTDLSKTRPESPGLKPNESTPPKKSHLNKQ